MEGKIVYTIPLEISHELKFHMKMALQSCCRNLMDFPN